MDQKAPLVVVTILIANTLYRRRQANGRFVIDYYQLVVQGAIVLFEHII